MQKSSVSYNQLISHKRDLNPIALRRAKIAYNFGLSECNRVKQLAFDLFSAPILSCLGRVESRQLVSI